MTGSRLLLARLLFFLDPSDHSISEFAPHSKFYYSRLRAIGGTLEFIDPVGADNKYPLCRKILLLEQFSSSRIAQRYVGMTPPFLDSYSVLTSLRLPLSLQRRGQENLL